MIIALYSKTLNLFPLIYLAILLLLIIYPEEILSKKNKIHKKPSSWIKTRSLKDIPPKVSSWFKNGAKPPPYRITPRSGDKVRRKEYRTLTDSERKLFHDCLTLMKTTGAVDGYPGQTEYETFVIHHTFDYSPEAHESPAFLAFHRVFLYLFERLLRSHPSCHNVGLPYWDPTLDSFMRNPSQSVMFQDPSYIGNPNGSVTTGFLGKWSDVVPSYCQKIGHKLTRDVCNSADQLLTDAIIENFINCGRLDSCIYPNNVEFEDFHGLIHGCIGGHMVDLSCAPNDPCFYMYHSFVDLIFESYLRKNYPDWNAYKDYPQNVTKPYHRGNETVKPFTQYKILDGFSSNFTHLYYDYGSRPFFCYQDSDCSSKVLYCDETIKRCKAKVYLGGDCAELPDQACYGICSVGQTALCSRKTATCVCKSVSCIGKDDCRPNEWCDLKDGKCQVKYSIGEQCFNLPDQYCFGHCENTKTHDLKCVEGICTCLIKSIPCQKSEDCQNINDLFCNRVVKKCQEKLDIGNNCNLKFGGDMCGGFCPPDEWPVCSVATNKCDCELRICHKTEIDCPEDHVCLKRKQNLSGVCRRIVLIGDSCPNSIDELCVGECKEESETLRCFRGTCTCVAIKN